LAVGRLAVGRLAVLTLVVALLPVGTLLAVGLVAIARLVAVGLVLPVGTLPVLTLTIGLLTIALVRRTVGGRTGAVARAGVGVDRLGLGGALGAGTHSRRVVDLARRTGVVLSDAGPGSIGSGLAGGEALRRRLAVFGPSVAVPVADL